MNSAAFPHTPQTAAAPKLMFVVPCYNEEAVLPLSLNVLTSKLASLRRAGRIAGGSLVLAVDDGSADETWALISRAAGAGRPVYGVKLAHNVGHQHALWAGLEQAAKLRADVIVSIDADLQDDVDVVDEMLEKYSEGNDIVYGVRNNRATDTFFKRSTALLFYKLMRHLGADVVYNHADFRLMSRRSVEALLAYPERNLFLRGMVKTLGFPTATVSYKRQERRAGQSKYPLRRMCSFALDGITSFSVRPLRLIVTTGLSFIVISLLAIIYALWSFVAHSALPGWTSLLISVWFIGGAILTSLGIIGEYVGKIYKEVKRRPRYIIEQTTDSPST